MNSNTFMENIQNDEIILLTFEFFFFSKYANIICEELQQKIKGNGSSIHMQFKV